MLAVGASLFFLSIAHLTSFFAEFADPKKRTLCTVLTFSASRPNISFDLRRPPEATSFFGSFRPQPSDMGKPAVMPAAARMRLVHPRLPWFVDVRPHTATYPISIYDVLRTLYDELTIPIAGRDFWNSELSKKDRESLTRAFKDRCLLDGRERSREEMLKGVKRIDFLGADVVFVGLVRRNGMWEIKTTSDH
jgi:hypothetical protein